jgi:hypothetical protein
LGKTVTLKYGSTPLLTKTINTNDDVLFSAGSGVSSSSWTVQFSSIGTSNYVGTISLLSEDESITLSTAGPVYPIRYNVQQQIKELASAGHGVARQQWADPQVAMSLTIRALSFASSSDDGSTIWRAWRAHGAGGCWITTHEWTNTAGTPAYYGFIEAMDKLISYPNSMGDIVLNFVESPKYSD